MYYAAIVDHLIAVLELQTPATMERPAWAAVTAKSPGTVVIGSLAGDSGTHLCTIGIITKIGVDFIEADAHWHAQMLRTYLEA